MRPAARSAPIRPEKRSEMHACGVRCAVLCLRSRRALPATAALDARDASRSSRRATATRRSRPSAALVASGEPRAAAVLKALADGEHAVAGGRVLIVKGEDADGRRHRRRRSIPCARSRSRGRGRQQPPAPRARRGDGGAEARLRPTAEARRAAARELAGRARRGDAAARAQGARGRDAMPSITRRRSR